MKTILSFFIILSVVSCGKTVLNAELGTPFKMTNAEAAKVNETDLKMNGFKVIEDSRCPKNANCIWEGQIVAEFDLNGAPFKMNTQKMTDTLGYSFKIQSVLPEKVDGATISLPDYILEILVTKYQKQPSQLELE